MKNTPFLLPSDAHIYSHPMRVWRYRINRDNRSLVFLFVLEITTSQVFLWICLIVRRLYSSFSCERLNALPGKHAGVNLEVNINYSLRSAESRIGRICKHADSEWHLSHSLDNAETRISIGMSRKQLDIFVCIIHFWFSKFISNVIKHTCSSIASGINSGWMV